MISLNLLPPERKQFIAGRRRNQTILFWESSLVVVLLLVVVALLALTVYTRATIATRRQELAKAQEDLQRFADIEELVLVVRDRTSALATQEKNRLRLAAVVSDLAAATPNGLQLTQVNLTVASTPHLNLTGRALDKERVASFRERLEQSARFAEVIIRQVGQTVEDDRTFTTFSIEANLEGVAKPKPRQPTREEP